MFLIRFELYLVFLELQCHTPSFLCQHFFSDKGQDGLGDLLQLLFLSIFDVFQFFLPRQHHRKLFSAELNYEHGRADTGCKQKIFLLRDAYLLQNG